MQQAYHAWHRKGIVQSIETWMDGVLVGGLYGVALGRAFFGESMFTRVPDASKIALEHVARRLERWSFGLIDCQMATAHLARFGAREIPRAAFLGRLSKLVNYPSTQGKWHCDDDLSV